MPVAEQWSGKQRLGFAIVSPGVIFLLLFVAMQMGRWGTDRAHTLDDRGRDQVRGVWQATVNVFLMFGAYGTLLACVVAILAVLGTVWYSLVLQMEGQ